MACSYGVDHDHFRPVAVPEGFLDRLGLRLGGPTLLYVGSEAPRKRVHLLLHVLAALGRRGVPDAVLVKVGAPHNAAQRERLRALADALSVSTQVRWVDGVTEHELVWLYNAATLYVSAAGREGFGLPVLEAMACGLPVAVSDIASHREIVGDVGRLLPSAASGWTDALAALLKDQSRRDDAGARGRERASAFTWERTTRCTVAVYERLATQGALC